MTKLGMSILLVSRLNNAAGNIRSFLEIDMETVS